VALEIRIAGESARIQQGRKVVLGMSAQDLCEALAGASEPRGGELLPNRARFFRQRGDATAVAIELPPQTRTVRWLKRDSPEPFGPGAQYETLSLAFPYVVLLLVFKDGGLVGLNQLFYRTESLDVDQELLLSNLPNVANIKGMRSWVCLMHLGPVDELPWDRKIGAIVTHLFGGGFNRSADVHEGNSLWASMRGLDPRIETPEAWQEATRVSPQFPVEVAWKPAGVTMQEELMRMLDCAAPRRRLQSVEDLVGLFMIVDARRRKKK
jgi:hypothetical protein